MIIAPHRFKFTSNRVNTTVLYNLSFFGFTLKSASKNSDFFCRQANAALTQPSRKQIIFRNSANYITERLCLTALDSCGGKVIQ